MPDETALAFAEVLGERNEGFMQMTYVSGDIKHDLRHYEELAEVLHFAQSDPDSE